MKKPLLFLLLLILAANLLAQESSHKWKLAVSGGMAFMTASSKDAEKDMISSGISSSDAKGYFKDLKRGKVASANLVYLFNSNLGVGVKYNFFASSAKLNDVALDAAGTGDLYRGTIEDKRYYNFIGPSFYSQNSFGQDKFRLTAQLALGYLHFRNEGRSSNEFIGNVLYTGGTLGANAEIGVEYFITNNMALGLSAESLVGRVSSVNITDGQTSVKNSSSEKEDLNHIGIFFGIRFYK